MSPNPSDYYAMRTTWRMYRTKEGEWVVYSGPLSFTTSDRFEVEKRLAKHGCSPDDVQRLFVSQADKGEGVVSVPIGLERLQELNAPTVVGSHGSYRWLTTGQHGLDSFCSYCPQALLGKSLRWIAARWFSRMPRIKLAGAVGMSSLIVPKSNRRQNVEQREFLVTARGSTSGMCLILLSTLALSATATYLNLL